MSNFMRSKMELVIDHAGMSDTQLKKLMQKIVKSAKGRSQREVSLHAGDLSVGSSDL